ncbi:glycosyltransferase family protein [Xanthomonas graminis]|uniref:hypothetical protein n=1 Tax=Xanthomonas graminis TaxID=3390026 RepID=UPI001F2527E1|nr:hypothetical protein [Xanthomonas translucens]UKE72785.1 hypothetical protein KFS85_17410 [Xanthomonas translucens pv. phleipratensis]
MQSRWQQMLSDDPAYSPCLSLEAPAFSPDPDPHALVLARNSYPVYPVECTLPVTRGTFPESQMYETIALSVTPLRQIAPLAPGFLTTASHAAVWRASGSDPQVELRWQGEALAGGWYLFTDEDKIDVEGKCSDPCFKSDWNPDLFLSQNCVCHLTVYRATCGPRSPSCIATNRPRRRSPASSARRAS